MSLNPNKNSLVDVYKFFLTHKWDKGRLYDDKHDTYCLLGAICKVDSLAVAYASLDKNNEKIKQLAKRIKPDIQVTDHPVCVISYFNDIVMTEFRDVLNILQEDDV